MRVLQAFFPALAAILLLGAAAPSDVIPGTPVRGGMAIGSTAAPTKLVEYFSYTCPHCRAFAAGASQPIDKLVREGKLRVEYRNAVRDPLDLAAAVLAHCAGPQHYLAIHEAVFAHQDALTDKATTVPDYYTRAVLATSKDATAVANGSGLTTLVESLGVPHATIERCLGDEPLVNRIKADSAKAWKTIQGTPTILVNGKVVPVEHWARLAPYIPGATAPTSR